MQSITGRRRGVVAALLPLTVSKRTGRVKPAIYYLYSSWPVAPVRAQNVLRRKPWLPPLRLGAKPFACRDSSTVS